MQTFTPIVYVLAGGLSHILSITTLVTKANTRAAENKANPKPLPVMLTPSSTPPVPDTDGFQIQGVAYHFIPLGLGLTLHGTAVHWHPPLLTPKAVHTHQIGACP